MSRPLRRRWDWLLEQRWLLPGLLVAGLALSFAIPEYGLLNKYVQMVLMYVGINIILAVSLNLVNGFMGEFSLAHAGFMAVGAYTAALLTMRVLPVAEFPAPRCSGSWWPCPRSRCGATTSRSSRSPS